MSGSLVVLLSSATSLPIQPLKPSPQWKIQTAQNKHSWRRYQGSDEKTQSWFRKATETVSGLPGSQGTEEKAQPSSFIRVTKEGYLSGRPGDLNNAVTDGSGKISFAKGQRASPFIKQDPSKSMCPLLPPPASVTAGWSSIDTTF